MPEITLQLYTLREALATDFLGTLRKVADIGFACVEPAGLPGVSASEARRLMDDLGLEAPTAHCQLPIGDQRNEVIETALELGHRYLITGGPPNWRESFTDAESIKSIADLYCEAAENAAAHGLQVGYHNHDFELAEAEGRPIYKAFLEHTPETVLWQADLFWVALAGKDPAAFLKEIGPRGKALHFKDGHLKDRSIKPPFLPAGEGDVDLKAAAPFAQHAEYIAVELDAYEGDMLEAVQKSYRYLTSEGIARGRN